GQQQHSSPRETLNERCQVLLGRVVDPMHVLDFDNQWTMLTALETHLRQCPKDACSYGFWRQASQRGSPVFHTQKLQKIGGRVFGVHADFLEHHVYLLDDGFWAIRLADATVMVQYINQGVIRHRAPIGETASFKIGDPLVL